MAVDQAAVATYREAVMDATDEELLAELKETRGMLAFLNATEPMWMPMSDGKRSAMTMVHLAMAELKRRGVEVA